jgi:hypothetical protein
MQALALKRNQTQEFGDLEHPEKVAACKEMFRALGYHRKLYPFVGGETSKAKLHDAGFSWFPAHVPYQRFAEQSEL